MNGTVRCFIRIHGQYKEISYEELLKRKETDASYRDKRFIPLHGMLLEVPPEETTTLSKYLREEAFGTRSSPMICWIPTSSLAPIS